MPDSSDTRAAASRLQVWGFPLVMAQRVRLNFTRPSDPDAPRPPSSAGAALDRLGHQRTLSDPTLRVGVAPNVDTLYSVAWLDLDHGKFRLSLPDMGSRYYSVQVALADTRSPWALGQRTHGGLLPPISLHRGPLAMSEDEAGIACVTPHRYLMLCVRVLVEPEDPEDLARVHALQDQMVVRRIDGVDDVSLAVATQPGPTEREVEAFTRDAETSEPAAFGRALARVVLDLDPDAVPASVRDDLATSGLHGSSGWGESAWARDVERGLAEGLEIVDRRVQTMAGVVNGWALNDRGPDVGDDLVLRAAVARAQIFVNPAEEAVYPVCEVDDRGEALDGARHDYALVLAAGQLPPAAAFWSLTLYHRAGLLVENELGRHAIGDRTPGLRLGEDGSLTVHVSASPAPGGTLNWLPAPRGPFRLMLRIYCPTDRRWAPPPVVRTT